MATITSETFNVVKHQFDNPPAKWRAWLETKRPLKLFVGGLVECANPGVEPLLTRQEPQGFNPEYLILRLDLVQKPGVWPQVIVSKSALYEEIPAFEEYAFVQIKYDDDELLTIPVDKL